MGSTEFFKKFQRHITPEFDVERNGDAQHAQKILKIHSLDFSPEFDIISNFLVAVPFVCHIHNYNHIFLARAAKWHLARASRAPTWLKILHKNIRIHMKIHVFVEDKRTNSRENRCFCGGFSRTLYEFALIQYSTENPPQKRTNSHENQCFCEGFHMRVSICLAK